MTNSGAGFNALPGATNAALTLANLQASSVGSIELIVSNSVGSNATSVATVTILPDPPAPTPGEPYAYTVYSYHPLVYWRMNETGDTTAGNLPAYDSSGNGYDAVYGPGATDNETGPQSPVFPGLEATNTCVLLPGPNGSGGSGYLTSPDLNLNTNTVTFTAWINPDANVVTTAGLLVWRNSSGDGAGFGFGNEESTNGMTELGYTWNVNSSLTWNFDSQLFPPLNQWSFAALTVTPTNATIFLYYVDATTGATDLLNSVNTLAHTPEAFSGGIIRVGDDTFDNYRVFPGHLDEVAVFAHCLSESQLQNLFFVALGAPPQVSLSYTWNGEQLSLSWAQGTLMQSTDLAGPWTTNSAPSPLAVIPAGTRMMFYRVKVQ